MSPRYDRSVTTSLLPDWVGAVVIGSAFAVLWCFEGLRPLRRSVEPRLRREGRNFAVAAVGFAVVLVAERPAIVPLAEMVERRGWGIVQWLELPLAASVLVSFLLMDYTLYVWHMLNHRVPFLWRFHAPHHADLDLDASTALRFHFGELLLSVPFRAAQVLVIGTPLLAYSIWQTILFAMILFHHSNARLSLRIERVVAWLVVTPRLHGIHHSFIRGETNSNWSSGLSWWDRLHGTIRADVPQERITIGLPAYRDPRDVSFGKVLAMPFHSRDAWRLPGDGEPVRGSDKIEE